MYTKGRKKGTVRFSVRPANGAEKVSVAGDFSNWVPMAMYKQKNGAFAAAVLLEPGTYEYKYIVDGQWQVDPDNGVWAMNCYGTMNSVVQHG